VIGLVRSILEMNQMADHSPIFRVRALVIVCTDVERSKRFYTAVLGATVIATDNGVGWWYRLGSFDINLLPNAAKPSPANFPTHAMPILWLEVASLSAAAEHFARSEITVLDPGDGNFMQVADPDGLVIEVWQTECE
jgi:catechol 2,3-dioxygenase-like lactoylglutathione lyase family enzyme